MSTPTPTPAPTPAGIPLTPTRALAAAVRRALRMPLPAAVRAVAPELRRFAAAVLSPGFAVVFEGESAGGLVTCLRAELDAAGAVRVSGTTALVCRDAPEADPADAPVVVHAPGGEG